MYPACFDVSYFADCIEKLLHVSPRPSYCTTERKKSTKQITPIKALIQIDTHSFCTVAVDKTFAVWDKMLRRQPSKNPISPHTEGTLTTMRLLQSGFWVSGFSDGTISSYQPAESQLYVRRQLRKDNSQPYLPVRCLAIDEKNNGESIYVGFPNFLQVWNLRKLTSSSNVEVSPRGDHLSSIIPLKKSLIALVIGSKLETWERTKINKISYTFKKRDTLYQPPQTVPLYRPPNISACSLLDPYPNCALGFTTGSIKVINYESGKDIVNYAEHLDEVTTCFKIDYQVFGSASKDRCVKIWDLRQMRPALSIGPHDASVSHCLAMDANSLLASTDPDPQGEVNLIVWDVRNIRDSISRRNVMALPQIAPKDDGSSAQ